MLKTTEEILSHPEVEDTIQGKFTQKRTNDAITALEQQVRVLKTEVEALRTKSKLNEWRIKELESITQGYLKELPRVLTIRRGLVACDRGVRSE